MSTPVVVWALLSLIWGSTWLFIKVGLQDLPPFTFAALRFAVAIVALIPLLVIRRPHIPRRPADWRLMIWTGVLTFTVAYGLVFWGEQHISSGLAALLFSTFPLFGLMIAHVALPSERMTWSKVAGVVLGIGGIGLVFSNELTATGAIAMWGSAAIVAAALSAAYADVLIKLRGANLDPSLLTFVQMIAGFLPLAILGAVREGNPLDFTWTPLAVVSLLYLAVPGTALAFVLLYWLIKHMAVTRTMLITLVTPIIAVGFGIALLGEHLTWRTAVGGTAIVAGIGLTVWQETAALKERAAVMLGRRRRAVAAYRDDGPTGVRRAD
jgi:drug/metabolite transporter (DMT)-like permease